MDLYNSSRLSLCNKYTHWRMLTVVVLSTFTATMNTSLIGGFYRKQASSSITSIISAASTTTLEKKSAPALRGKMRNTSTYTDPTAPNSTVAAPAKLARSAPQTTENDSISQQIQVLRAEDFLARGPSLHSFRDWSQYLHFLIYKEAVPREEGSINFRLENGTGIAYEGYPYTPPDVSRWDNNTSNWHRKGRFPSVEERIRFYMGRWYDAKSIKDLFGKEFSKKTKDIKDIPEDSKLKGVFLTPHVNPFKLSPESLFNFSMNSKEEEEVKPKRRLTQVYTRDIIDLAILHSNSTTPILVKMGDGSPQTTELFDHSYPVFGKVRDLIAEKNDLNHWRYDMHPDCRQCGSMHSTIIWPLNRGRHFKPAAHVPQHDIPWEKKKGKLVWRGGAFSAEMESLQSLLPTKLSSWKQRLALVRNHLKSELVDAKFTGDQKYYPKKKYFGKSMNMEEMLQYKYLMSIEGNDISSGLKWMLFSNSVVFLPPITYASWAMEPLLEPFVHYIPVHANMSNVEEMVLWAENHPEEARHIAERSTLFAYDLLFHPDSYHDEELILAGIMKQYERKFGKRGEKAKLE